MCFWISFKSVLRFEPSSILFDSWGLFDPHTTNPYHIWHQILFWNTLEINYLTPDITALFDRVLV